MESTMENTARDIIVKLWKPKMKRKSCAMEQNYIQRNENNNYRNFLV